MVPGLPDDQSDMGTATQRTFAELAPECSLTKRLSQPQPFESLHDPCHSSLAACCLLLGARLGGLNAGTNSPIITY